MNYQLIALDMDGTLLDGAKRVRQTSVDAIERALDAGVSVAICSGRCPAMVEHHRDELPGLRYAICSSGATLFDLADQRVLSALSFEAAVIKQLRDLTADLDFSPDAFCGRDFFFEASVFDSMDRYGIAEYEELFRTSGAGVGNVWESALAAPSVEKVDLHFADLADRDVARERVRELPVELACSDSMTLEISPEGANKGAGLLELARILGVAREATVGVGDSDNDLPMLAVAGLSVAMGNANERVRAAADLVVSDNDHDGVAEAIERALAGTA